MPTDPTQTQVQPIPASPEHTPKKPPSVADISKALRKAERSQREQERPQRVDDPFALSEGTRVQLPGDEAETLHGESPPQEVAPQEVAPTESAPPGEVARPVTAPPDDPRAAAAEAAALWNDTEDIAYHDEDTGQDYVVRAPKTYAEHVKRGYSARSVMDRNARYLSRARPVLEPLITTGTIDRILPLLQLAITDARYAQYVADGYLRVTQGADPFVGQQEQAPAPSAAAPTAVSAEGMDPWLAEQMKPYMDRMNAALAQRDETITQLRVGADQYNEAQRQDYALRSTANRLAADVHRDMCALYPDEFTGDFTHDAPLLAEIHGYIDRTGLARQYGFTPATYRLARMQMLSDRAAAAAPRAASPAVQNIADIQRRARQEAAAEAATLTGAGGARAAAPAPSTDPFDGVKRDIRGKKITSAKQLASAMERAMAAAGGP